MQLIGKYIRMIQDPVYPMRVDSRMNALTALFAAIVLWMVASVFLKNTGNDNLILVISAVAALSISMLLARLFGPSMPRKLQWLLLALLAIKLAGSVAYFDHFFVSRSTVGLVLETYGDSHTHHTAALQFMEIWDKFQWRLGISYRCMQDQIPTAVSSWGYAAFLGVLYLVTGIVPEVGIVFNGFLAFLFCVMSYRIFVLARLTSHQATLGAAIVFFCPALWLWSSLLYKDLLLFCIVLACVLSVLRLGEAFTLRRVLAVIVLLVMLLPLRYAYAAPLLVMLVLAPIHLRAPEGRRVWSSLLTSGCVLLVLAGVQAQFNLTNTCTSVTSSAAVLMDLKPTGGSFMSNGLGSVPPNITNFWYTLPARAVYILFIPMPWFGGQSPVEKVDYLVSHLDAVYDSVLFMAVPVMALQRKCKPTREQLLILGVGLIYFVIPLYFFFPGRRYMTITVPFLLAYALPALVQQRKAATSAGMAVALIVVVQFAYLLK